MPDGVLEDLSNQEMHLIQKAIRHISHRRCYELKSAEYIKEIINTFFKKIDKSIEDMKSIPHHP